MFGLVLAFKDFNYANGIFGSDWNGIDNFRFFFASQDMARVVFNTVSYSITFIFTGLFAAVFVAVMLFEIKHKYAIKTYQTIMILPNFLSWVIVGYISYTLLNPQLGVFNSIITFFGGERVDWYANSSYWPPILVIANIWKHVGMNSIIYYAALMGIDSEIYEAATVDGAGRIRQILHISIPALIPVMTILTILAMSNLFRGDFGLFYQLPRDVSVLYPTTDVIDTYIFRGLRKGDISVGSAIGLVQSVVGFVFVLITNAVVKKIDNEVALF